MIAALSLVALAEPPRAQLTAGWSGNAEQSFGFAAVQPAVARSIDAAFVLRATASHVNYQYLRRGVHYEVDSPGLSVGPAFVYAPEDFGLHLGVGVGVRHVTWSLDGVATKELRPDATLSGDVYWRPDQRAQIYGLFSFTAADPYLWARAGATHPLIPLVRRDAAASLWLGAEATTSGTFYARMLEAGPVAELAIRDLGAVVSVRGGLALRESGQAAVESSPSIGLGVYWAY
jgi:hypothetical protein